MAREGFASVESTASQAKALIAQGRYPEAERYYRELVAQTHVIDYAYDDWLRSLCEIYEQLGRRREAGFIHLYLHYFELALANFAGPEGAAARARVEEVQGHHRAAAELYREAGLPVHAAVALEAAGDPGGAAATWEALQKSPKLRDRPYEVALVHFNFGMAKQAAEPGSGAARRALIESQRFLEQVADEFEIRGERERAFDCYQILLKLGRDSGQFENLAEGYLSCIRVLKEDNLKFYVLQYYEEFIKLALERDELHAAATLYQEVANFASRAGLPYDRHYLEQAALTWVKCAEELSAAGAPVELAENAYLAAISSYSSVGRFAQVRRLFEALASMELSAKKRARYQRIGSHYDDAGSDRGEAPPFPDYLRQQHYADIWFVDLLEWEMAGAPAEVALSIVGDLRYPDGIRRRSLMVLLTHADAESRGQEKDPETLARIAELLGELQSYAALSPLEALYEHSDPRVRRAAIRALRFLFFKRSFVLLRAALEDSDSTVVNAAADALKGLHFPHAFNPLARIYRESESPLIRAVALESIGKIQSLEAGEFLLSVLRQESGELREVARRALAALDNPDVAPILRQYQQIETDAEVARTLAALQADRRE